MCTTCKEKVYNVENKCPCCRREVKININTKSEITNNEERLPDRPIDGARYCIIINYNNEYPFFNNYF